jgi:hypothetical protein
VPSDEGLGEGGCDGEAVAGGVVVTGAVLAVCVAAGLRECVAGADEDVLALSRAGAGVLGCEVPGEWTGRWTTWLMLVPVSCRCQRSASSGFPAASSIPVITVMVRTKVSAMAMVSCSQRRPP